jgi:protein-tyrosine kinase
MTVAKTPVHLVERAAQRLRELGTAGALDLLAEAAPAPAAALPLSSESGAQAAAEPSSANQANARQAETAVASPAREVIDTPRLERAGMVGAIKQSNRLLEEFRIVQGQIIRNMPVAGSGTNVVANTIMVASALPGEGKTFVALNLAASIARYSDRKVLLVDIDAKPKSLSHLLGVSDAPGLLDMAASRGGNHTDTVVMTELPKLLFVPIGAYQEYANLPIAPAVIGLGRRFPDHVIILDAPPCLSSSTPSTLASLVGQIVLVVEAERTQRSEIEAALDLIGACPTVALMLNKIQLNASYTFGAYHYYYGSPAASTS